MATELGYPPPVSLSLLGRLPAVVPQPPQADRLGVLGLSWAADWTCQAAVSEAKSGRTGPNSRLRLKIPAWRRWETPQECVAMGTAREPSSLRSLQRVETTMHSRRVGQMRTAGSATAELRKLWRISAVKTLVSL